MCGHGLLWTILLHNALGQSHRHHYYLSWHKENLNSLQKLRSSPHHHWLVFQTDWYESLMGHEKQKYLLFPNRRLSNPRGLGSLAASPVHASAASSMPQCYINMNISTVRDLVFGSFRISPFFRSLFLGGQVYKYKLNREHFELKSFKIITFTPEAHCIVDLELSLDGCCNKIFHGQKIRLSYAANIVPVRFLLYRRTLFPTRGRDEHFKHVSGKTGQT